MCRRSRRPGSTGVCCATPVPEQTSIIRSLSTKPPPPSLYPLSRVHSRTHSRINPSHRRVPSEFVEARSVASRQREPLQISPPASLPLIHSISLSLLSFPPRVFRDPAGCSNASGGVRAAVVSRGETRHNAEPRERRVATVTSRRPEESRHRTLARYSPAVAARAIGVEVHY